MKKREKAIKLDDTTSARVRSDGTVRVRQVIDGEADVVLLTREDLNSILFEMDLFRAPANPL